MELDKIRQRLDDLSDGKMLDVEFMYNAPEEIDWLLGEVKRLEARVREVVEWVKAWGVTAYISDGDYTYDTHADNQIFLDLGDWQTQLKEWGLGDGNKHTTYSRD